MKIKVLLIIPNRKVQVVRIPSNIKFLKDFLGKELCQIRLDKNNILVADRKAEYDDFNRIYNGEIIRGPFFVISIKNRQRRSLNKKDIKKYSDIFKLEKHKITVDRYKEEYLEKYYLKQAKIKTKNKKHNKEVIFKSAA